MIVTANSATAEGFTPEQMKGIRQAQEVESRRGPAREKARHIANMDAVFVHGVRSSEGNMGSNNIYSKVTLTLGDEESPLWEIKVGKNHEFFDSFLVLETYTEVGNREYVFQGYKFKFLGEPADSGEGRDTLTSSYLAVVGTADLFCPIGPVEIFLSE